MRFFFFGRRKDATAPETPSAEGESAQATPPEAASNNVPPTASPTPVQRTIPGDPADDFPLLAAARAEAAEEATAATPTPPPEPSVAPSSRRPTRAPAGPWSSAGR
ncbi:MAG: hypothetical protein NTW19_13575 [Planctomycetota bacterium]|nr:hypothetical protein [Planctomycetota bacterium]